MDPKTLSTRKPKPEERIERPFKGVWIDRSIWESDDLTWQEKCLLAEIDWLGKEDGCFATNDFLARHFKCTPKRMANQISDLVTRGWLKSSGGKKRALKLGAKGQAPNRRAPAIRDGDDPAMRERDVPHSGIDDPAMREHGGGTINILGTSKVPLRNPADAASPNGEHKLFVTLWVSEYEKHFEERYVFQGGKDAKAVQRLLANSKETAIVLIATAKAAWANLEKFNCNHAGSISGFVARYNEIRRELSGKIVKADHENTGWDRDKFYSEHLGIETKAKVNGSSI